MDTKHLIGKLSKLRWHRAILYILKRICANISAKVKLQEISHKANSQVLRRSTKYCQGI